MLNKENRLKKRKEFGYIYKNGTCVRTKHLTLLYTATKLNKCRVGFSVNKKVGKAFMRNKVKRRLRAIVRELIPTMNKKMNYIFLAKEGIYDLEYSELQQEVLYLLKKIGA